MFATLSDRLTATFKGLRGKGRLSEADVDTALREVRVALLEADVNFKVARDFIERVKTKALGAQLAKAGWGEPITGLLAAGFAAMVLGYGDSISYDQLVQRITGDNASAQTATAAIEILRLSTSRGWRRPRTRSTLARSRAPTSPGPASAVRRRWPPLPAATLCSWRWRSAARSIPWARTALPSARPSTTVSLPTLKT